MAMKCGKFRDELMEAVLSGPELATPAMQEHLASCPACAQELTALRQTMDLLEEWQVPQPSPYFSARLRARLRDEHAQQGLGWLAWLRRPVVVTAAAALMAIGVGMLEGVHWKATHEDTMAVVEQPQEAGSGAAVTDLQYLDSHADLFTDFDALDDNQAETN